MDEIRVVLAEDHHVVRAAVASFLTKEKGIEVVGEVADTTTLLEVVGRLKPDILLLDAHMPGQMVVKAAEMLREQHPDVTILVLSAYDRREYIVGLLRAGASGYVLKDDSPEMLVQAIHAVARGQEWLSPRVARTLVESVRRSVEKSSSRLTNRESEVLRLMAKGLRNDEIAEVMIVTTQTVKNHVRSIFRKLEVESRVEAVLYALNHDLA